MNLEEIAQKFVDGVALTPEERNFLIFSLEMEKTSMARFRVSEAEKIVLQKAAAQAGLNLSEYLRSLTIREIIVPLMNGNQHGD